MNVCMCVCVCVRVCVCDKKIETVTFVVCNFQKHFGCIADLFSFDISNSLVAQV